MAMFTTQKLQGKQTTTGGGGDYRLQGDGTFMRQTFNVFPWLDDVDT